MLIRGTIYLMLSQVVFLLCGYGVHIFLAREFGPTMYGNFGVIISIIVWFELAVIRGIPTAVQNFIAKDQKNAFAIKKFFFYIQLLIATILFIILLVSSPLIANLLNDGALTDFIRIAAFDLIIYAIYALYVSVQNGLGEFKKQAIIISCYSLFRGLSIILLVKLGFALKGALIGNMIGSFAGMVIGISFCKLEKKKPKTLNKKGFVQFVIPTTLFFLVVNLLYNIDLWYVKAYLLKEAAGYYTSAQNLAKVPLFFFFALSFTLLPLLAKAIEERNYEKAVTYISQSVRILALVLLPVILLVNATSEPLIEMLYSEKYMPSVSILNILIIAFSLLAFYISMATVLIAKNEPSIPFIITFCLVLFDIILNSRLIPLWGTVGAAVSTTFTACVGAVIIGFWVFKDYRVDFKIMSLVKIITASLVVFAVSNLYSTRGEWLIANYILLLSVYIGLLIFFREISREELLSARRLLLKH